MSAEHPTQNPTPETSRDTLVRQLGRAAVGAAAGIVGTGIIHFVGMDPGLPMESAIIATTTAGNVLLHGND